MSDSSFSPSTPADLHVAVPPAKLLLKVTSEAAELARVRKAVESYAKAVGFEEVAVAEVGLVVNEAMANVIRHAYSNEPGQSIEVEAEPTKDAEAGELVLTVRLRDWGNRLNPERVPTRGYTPGVPGGLGLVCLKQMMDTTEYAPQPDGMLLTMTKRQVLPRT